MADEIEFPPEECYSCGWETKELKAYDKPQLYAAEVREKLYFCDICASTFLSQPVSYPRLDHNTPDGRKLFASLGYLANYFKERLDKIEERLNQLQSPQEKEK